eukprot:255411_1
MSSIFRKKQNTSRARSFSAPDAKRAHHTVPLSNHKSHNFIYKFLAQRRKTPKSISIKPSTSCQWRPSLRTIINDSELVNALLSFTKRQFNDENIFFLQAVHKLTTKIDGLLSLHTDTDSDQQQRVIDSDIYYMYEMYITSNAGKQVNLSWSSWNNVICSYHEFTQWSLSQKRTIFAECVKEIENLVNQSVLSNFYLSAEFQAIAFTRDVLVHSHSGTQRDSVHKYMLSPKGYNGGCHEWSIEILNSNDVKHEVGIVSNFDQNIAVNALGICDTPLFGSRVVYGYNELRFFYASYNEDNSKRIEKDLSKLHVHKKRWSAGDVIRICLDLDKGKVKFYLNGKQVRKTISVEKNKTYYPIIMYGDGECEYKLSHA